MDRLWKREHENNKFILKVNYRSNNSIINFLNKYSDMYMHDIHVD